MLIRKLLLVLIILLKNCSQSDYSYQYVYQRNYHHKHHQTYHHKNYHHQHDYDSSRNSNEDEGNRWLCFILGICTTTFHPGSFTQNTPGLTIIHQWSQLEFDYETPYERENDIKHGVFVVGKPAPIDVDVYYSPNNSNKIFVTIPRFENVSPITLGTITNKIYNNNPVIRPYPDWSWHRNLSQCRKQRLVSVFRVQIDECGRLWVLDTGRIGDEQTCLPQILAFDLRTNELVHSYEIPKTLIESRSILVTPIVDVRRDAQLKCRDTFVYVADCQTYSIIVHDVRRKLAWKATDKTMYPYPNYGTYNILGDSFDLMDGVLGMALSPFRAGEDRKLFFHAMSSPTENWVYTSHLRNQSMFVHGASTVPEIFHTYMGERHTQSAAEAIDQNGIMYFGEMTDVTIDCWNTKTEYGPKNIDTIARDQQTLQFASGVKVVTNRRGIQELWLISTRFQKVATETLNPSEVNFRIQAGRIDDLIFNSKCRHRNSSPLIVNGGGYGLLKPSNKASAFVQAPKNIYRNS